MATIDHSSESGTPNAAEQSAASPSQDLRSIMRRYAAAQIAAESMSERKGTLPTNCDDKNSPPKE